MADYQSAGKKVAILIDGAFYLRRAHDLFGEKPAKARAKEACTYAMRHLSDNDSLYRIFIMIALRLIPIFIIRLPSSKSI